MLVFFCCVVLLISVFTNFAESGGWSEWSQWVGCSETCSDEPVSKQRFRSCSNPKPNTAMFTGSSGCHGEAVEERICEDVNPCPG